MTDLPPLPAFSHFLENSTHEMQRDAIRAYARAYAEEAVKQEREACAQECERVFGPDERGAKACAVLIRHRSQEAALRRMNEIDRELGEEP